MLPPPPLPPQTTHQQQTSSSSSSITNSHPKSAVSPQESIQEEPEPESLLKKIKALKAKDDKATAKDHPVKVYLNAYLMGSNEISLCAGFCLILQ